MKESNKTMKERKLNNAIDTSGIMVKWNPDPKGYFIIKPFFSKKKIFVRYYDSKNNLKYTFSGITTSQIYYLSLKKN